MRFRKGAVVLFIMFMSCSGGTGNKENTLESVLKEHLSKGEGEEAVELLRSGGLSLSECETSYASLLAHFLLFIESVNEIMNSISSLSPLVDYSDVIQQFIEPFETELMMVDIEADYVIEKNCSFYLPEGFKIEIGKEGDDYHLKVVLGDEWDKGDAMLFSIFANSILSVFDFIFSHSLDIDTMVVPEFYDEWIPTLRSLGSLFSMNPGLLEFSKTPDNKARFYGIPSRMKKISQNLYSDGGTTFDLSDDTGILAYIFNEDENPNDDVLGFLDSGDNNVLNVGDEFVIGIKSLNIADTIIFPEIVSGIHIRISSLIYQYFKTIFDEVKNYSQALYDQMLSVETLSHLYERIGFKGINHVLSLFGIPEIPEVFEFDFSAFFKNPKPMRRYLPYWYDHDNDVSTMDEFMLEGETFVPKGYPSLITTDSAHFPENAKFKYNVDEIKTITPRIPADKLFPQFDYTIPYIAFQDPAFNGAVYVNPSLTGEGVNEYIFPDNYLLNRAIARITIYIYEEITDSLLDVTVP